MDDFRQKLITFSERAVSLAPRCLNEESTKLFLILPFLNVLGYDDRNPHEVCPEHSADFSEKYKNRVDFAVLKEDRPIIAIECKCCGFELKDERGQLRSYFNAAPTVKMGVLTDGLVYEFYADSDEPNMMDQTAFLAVDLREVAKGKIEESALDGLRSLQKNLFDPENIGAEAKRKLIFQNVLQQLTALAEAPSEAFTRLLLQNAGLTNVRSKALPEYQDLVKGAFREFINLRILKRLDLSAAHEEKITPLPEPASSEPIQVPKVEDRITTTATELAVFRHVKQRLAFLVKDETLYSEIDHIEFKDYQGKFVVFYRKERKGRLFDFVEGQSPKYKFLFGEDGEVATDQLSDIDGPLLTTFLRRVQEEKRIQVAIA
ncbi:type I restriction enzyme HsdR N-terminal domain-containing protein [Microvirga yunnanensis]|uniref:type I restriction enzyme HsdR N-terminal domain-containing protein n=1 Tax=Microvirga yunnanensis TaxID=2953740 RepID=UPI0021C99A06|nr:type I restriction enzyme HsdR N-terminal domain-containing protein [Microvirga sp. HBU65207]